MTILFKIIMRLLAAFAVVSFIVILFGLYEVKQPMKGALMLSDLLLLWVWLKDEDYWKKHRQ